MSPFSKRTDGTVSWKSQPGDSYLVTGKTVDGKRFRQTHPTWFWANGINLWRGSKWLLRDGKRYLLCRVSN